MISHYGSIFLYHARYDHYVYALVVIIFTLSFVAMNGNLFSLVLIQDTPPSISKVAVVCHIIMLQIVMNTFLLKNIEMISLFQCVMTLVIRLSYEADRYWSFVSLLNL